MIMSVGAAAQAPKGPAATPVPAAPTATPDRTTATFGDWVLRCDRRADGTPSHRFCELLHTVQRPGDAGPQAQVAVGRLSPAEPIRMTVLLPVNVQLQTAPKLTPDGREATPIELTWIQCIPAGCFANGALSDDAIKKLRASKESGRLEFRDAAGREISLPISFRGLSEAWEAFLRDGAN